MDYAGLREKMANMDETQRMTLMEKMDKELDQYIESLESNSSRYVEGWSKDNWEKEMEEHPFFATSSNEGELSPLMQGIQDIKYSPDENSPLELALNYKEDGNYGFKYKKYRIAVASYSEGLKYTKDLPDLRTTLLTNRAAAQYYLKNYRSSLMDARFAIRTTPSHLKALIRGAKCSMELSRYKECIEWCERILANDPDNEEIKDIKTKAFSKKSEQERNERKEALRIHKESILLESLLSEITSRKINLVFSKHKDQSELTLQDLIPVHPFAPEAKRLHLNGPHLVWPVMFVYPEFQQSDFIQELSEDDYIFDHIYVVFNPEDEPPIWDTNQHYVASEVEAFFRHMEKDSLVKIDLKKHKFRDVLCDHRYSVIDGLPEIIILSPKSSFYRDYTKNSY
ncbi:DNA polymerase interacting tetratricopeptide repeat-containing, protein of 47 kDa [Lepeophtheirus salmonis]|uniref:DNA polymerase interacting tetratricopeptide repeat-containing, protein of 47 kDa n=1 Tax=Lepeophtheirus salmonis TaxID=72036 RepID=UPI001AE95598|nr:DNA polymerase interacting tetratricopeptide repeat-containing, protein of 47 kDa-like [Lepeophtheirus salmonis]